MRFGSTVSKMKHHVVTERELELKHKRDIAEAHELVKKAIDVLVQASPSGSRFEKVAGIIDARWYLRKAEDLLAGVGYE